MRLRSLDRYIKDKVHGYKPPFDENLWRGIEEKLPPARVPGGRGSWMLPVAAAVAISILAPFTIKFYNITGRNQEIAINNGKSDMGQTTVQSRVNSSIQSPISSAVYSASPSTSSSPTTSSSFAISSASTTPSSSHTYRTGDNSGPEHTKKHGLAAAFTKRHAHRNFQGLSEPSIGYTAGIENKQAGLQNQPNTTGVEIASNQKLSGKELMEYISPKYSAIASNANETISKKNETRYPDRKNHHPIKSDR